MKRTIICMVATILCCSAILAEEELQINSVQYWIDDNHTSATVSSYQEFDIGCAELPTGLHTIHFRVADNKGRCSALQEHGFFKVPVSKIATDIESMQYWWDDMYDNAVCAPYTAEQFVLSTDALPFGLHSLKYRVKDNAGIWSELRSHYFYKREATDSARIASYSYWWNDLQEKVVTKKLETPVASFELDEDFTVPEEARTNYAGHYTATLNIVVTDNRGRSAALISNVEYPDNDAPVTDIDADKYVASSTVKLTWTESTGDKMGDYNVYYSKDGEPFLLWLPDTKLTSSDFHGERGSVYVFTVTGRDAFGNREEYDETKCVSVTFE